MLLCLACIQARCRASQKALLCSATNPASLCLVRVVLEVCIYSFLNGAEGTAPHAAPQVSKSYTFVDALEDEMSIPESIVSAQHFQWPVSLPSMRVCEVFSLGTDGIVSPTLPTDNQRNCQKPFSS